nr:hypothetical protein [Phnomibacter ginsenosidimutans]
MKLRLGHEAAWPSSRALPASIPRAPSTVIIGGEVKVILINLSQEPQTIHSGDRIAQLVFQSVAQVQWQPVETLTETDRGAGGFGHTGKQ